MGRGWKFSSLHAPACLSRSLSASLWLSLLLRSPSKREREREKEIRVCYCCGGGGGDSARRLAECARHAAADTRAGRQAGALFPPTSFYPCFPYPLGVGGGFAPYFSATEGERRAVVVAFCVARRLRLPGGALLWRGGCQCFRGGDAEVGLKIAFF